VAAAVVRRDGRGTGLALAAHEIGLGHHPDHLAVAVDDGGPGDPADGEQARQLAQGHVLRYPDDVTAHHVFGDHGSLLQPPPRAPAAAGSSRRSSAAASSPSRASSLAATWRRTKVKSSSSSLCICLGSFSTRSSKLKIIQLAGRSSAPVSSRWKRLRKASIW